jgi:hypothetical protein
MIASRYQQKESMQRASGGNMGRARPIWLSPLILVLRPFHYGYGYEWTTMYPRGPNVFAGGSIAFGRGLTINRQTISLFSQIIAADLLRRGQIKGVNKKGPSVFTGLLSQFEKNDVHS